MCEGLRFVLQNEQGPDSLGNLHEFESTNPMAMSPMAYSALVYAAWARLVQVMHLADLARPAH